MRDAVVELANRKHALALKLVPAARAACNAMMDAKMERSARPMAEILFELDAVEQEMVALFDSNPAGAIAILIELAKGEKL